VINIKATTLAFEDFAGFSTGPAGGRAVGVPSSEKADKIKTPLHFSVTL
jgi:hypothetical protein